MHKKLHNPLHFYKHLQRPLFVFITDIFQVFIENIVYMQGVTTSSY